MTVAPSAGVSQTVRPPPGRSDLAWVRVTTTDTSSPSTVSTVRRTSKPTRMIRVTVPSTPPASVGADVELEVVRAARGAAELGDRAEEAHHEVVGRLVVELVGRADLLDAAVVDHHDLVGDLEGLLLVVGDEHGGDVDLVVQAAQPVAQLLADLGVERAERLVEQQHRRLDRQRPGEGHALALAARQLRRQPVGELLEVHELEQLVRPGRVISALGRLRISRPKATLRCTDRCLNAA